MDQKGGVTDTTQWRTRLFTYDSLGRLLTANNPETGTISYGYDADSNMTSKTSPAPNGGTGTVSYSFSYDALHRLTARASTGQPYESYTYDAASVWGVTIDNPIGRLVQADSYLSGCGNCGNGNVSTISSYDALGRLLTANNPETGTISYGYDADGNLTSKTAPNVNGGTGTITTTYAYDGLHRVTQRTFSNSNLTEDYFYDYASIWGVPLNNPVGRLVFTQSFNNSTSTVGTLHSYDALGPVQREQWVNQRSGATGKWFTFNYSYNLDGSLNTITYPSGRTVTYAYNAGQRPISAVDLANNINYATSAHYMGWGALASAVYGYTPSFAGITVNDQYNLRMQPQTLTASNPSGTILSLGYQFNYGTTDNGNVVGITNGLNSGRSQTFTYDYLNRILTGQSSATSGNSCWGEGFSYDMWANVTIRNNTKTGCNGEPAIPALSPQKNNQYALTYDLAGNLTANSGATYNYDGENRMTSATVGGTTTFDYDADGRRVQKSSGTLYWYGQDGEALEESDLSGNLKNEYVFFNGERVALRQDGAFQSAATIQNASLAQANPWDSCGSNCNYGPIPNWTSGGSGPTGSFQPTTSSYNAPLPGVIAYSNGGTLSQTLTSALQANTTYTLLVDVGQRLEAGLVADFALTLQAGSTVLATLRSSNGSTGAGTFYTQALTYTAPSSPPAGNLTIVLTSYGSQVNFKNVRLNLSAPATVNYYFEDELGSSRIITSATGTVCYDADLYPFGGIQNEYLNNCPQNYKFTGKERDAETGLDEFGARYYSSALGRFTIPDWAAKPTAIPYAKFGDPQTLNLYSYVENSPVNRADADGHCCTAGELADYLDSKVQVFRQDGLSANSSASPGVAAVNTFANGVTGDLAQGFTNLLRTGESVGSLPSGASGAQVINAAAEEGGRVGGTILVVVGVAAKASPAVNAQEVAGKAGTNSVETAAGRVDLQGDAHYSKAAGKDINTPHVHENGVNVDPSGTVHSFQSRVPRPATNTDVNAAAKAANVQVTPKPVLVKPKDEQH